MDERGHTYGATYPKRAKGLVKKGRARFVDETTICLACPPVIEWEDMNMQDRQQIDEIVTNETTEEIPEQPMPLAAQLLARIDRILEEEEFLYASIESLMQKDAGESSAETPGDSTKASALQAIVEAREATNQQMLRLLEKMYDRLEPALSEEGKMLKQLSEIVKDLPSDQAAAIVSKCAQQMFVRAGAEIVR